MRKIQNFVDLALKRGLEDGLAAHRESTLLQSEFKRFSNLSDALIRRSLLQLDFENILRDIKKEELKINLNDWCWEEYFDAASLTQVII
jgi:hypothetical protein